MSELKTPIFDKDNMFNRQGRKMWAVLVCEINDGGDVFRLWRHDGARENDFPAGENDEYYIYVEAAGYLIPLGWTLSGIAKRLGWPDMVAELYGSEEARAAHFEHLRGVLTDAEICREFNQETVRAVEIGMKPERLAAFVRRELDRHKAAYQQAEQDGGQSWPDYIGAALCGRLDHCTALMETHRTRKEQEARKRSEQAEKEDAAYVAEHNKMAQETIEKAADILLHGGTIQNEMITTYRSRYDTTDSPLILRLMDAYRVTVPPRTRAWIRDKVDRLIVKNDGTFGPLYYRRVKGSRPSAVVWDYLQKLADAVWAAA